MVPGFTRPKQDRPQAIMKDSEILLLLLPEQPYIIIQNPYSIDTDTPQSPYTFMYMPTFRFLSNLIFDYANYLGPAIHALRFQKESCNALKSPENMSSTYGGVKNQPSLFWVLLVEVQYSSGTSQTPLYVRNFPYGPKRAQTL